tara:strand:+ start:1197 stop:1583 length:387 start_codon:yes stop_codon:yes gene_type:complete
MSSELLSKEEAQESAPTRKRYRIYWCPNRKLWMIVDNDAIDDSLRIGYFSNEASRYPPWSGQTAARTLPEALYATGHRKPMCKKGCVIREDSPNCIHCGTEHRSKWEYAYYKESPTPVKEQGLTGSND